MKRFLLTCVVLLIVMPTQNVFSFSSAYKAVITEHRDNLVGETYKVQAWIGFNTGLLNTGDYVTISGGHLSGEITLIGPYEFSSGYDEFSYEWPEQSPSILSDFSNQTYTFKLYDHNGAQIPLEDDPVKFTSGTMEWLPLIDPIVTTSAGYSWLRWNDITGHGYINQYRVRVMNPDPSGPTILNDFILDGGKDYYTFSYYTEDLLSTYGEVTFRLEARQFKEIETDVWVLTNRSTLYHSVTTPCEGDFDGDGVVDGTDLAIFAADFGRTDCAVSP